MIAELGIALHASKLGIRVLRPMAEGARYDLVFDLGATLIRVQCKWAAHHGDVIKVPTRGSYHSPGRGYVRSTYSRADVDGIAAYCQDLDRCYWLPIDVFSGQSMVNLRLTATLNRQRAAVNMASEYEFGAVAQLGERLAGSEEVRGSSPLSSTSDPPATLAAYDYRQKFGWYMERAAAGETFLITRRGKPYARLSPPHLQLDLAPEPAEVVPITTAKENR